MCAPVSLSWGTRVEQQRGGCRIASASDFGGKLEHWCVDGWGRATAGASVRFVSAALVESGGNFYTSCHKIMSCFPIICRTGRNRTLYACNYPHKKSRFLSLVLISLEKGLGFSKHRLILNQTEGSSLKATIVLRGLLAAKTARVEAVQWSSPVLGVLSSLHLLNVRNHTLESRHFLCGGR